MYESMADAHRVASEILDQSIDANLGCGLIATISAKLSSPTELQPFELLAHEQSGHEHIGIQPNELVPLIVQACHELLHQ